MSGFSERLSALRRGAGMTQAELAKKLGISKSSVSMYECGNREPEFDLLEKMADLLQVDMNVLLGRGEPLVNNDPELTAYLEALRDRPEMRAAGLRVYILSATRHALLDPAIERLGVAPLVDGVYAEEETGSKRTEAPYAFFRDRFGVPYEKMLLAEDAPRNLAAAEALGVSGVGVYDESMKEYTEMIRAGAAVYLPDFSDLSALEELLR